MESRWYGWAVLFCLLMYATFIITRTDDDIETFVGSLQDSKPGNVLNITNGLPKLFGNAPNITNGLPMLFGNAPNITNRQPMLPGNALNITNGPPMLPGNAFNVITGSGVAVPVTMAVAAPKRWTVGDPNLKCCLTVLGGKYSAGNKIVQWPCNSSDPNQTWDSIGIFTNPTTRASTQMLKSGTNPAYCASVAGRTSGSLLQLAACDLNDTNQWFDWDSASKTMKATGSGKCIDMPNATVKDNGLIQIWDCNGYAPAQTVVSSIL